MGVERPKAKIILFAFLINLFFMMYAPAQNLWAEDRKHTGSIDCHINREDCTKYLEGRQVTLAITPKPVKAMQDLTFRVSLPGKQPTAAPFIDLGMPGMKMGPNRVLMKPFGDGLYEGRGIIVRCSSGRRTWRARVTVPDRGFVEFTFDVVY